MFRNPFFFTCVALLLALACGTPEAPKKRSTDTSLVPDGMAVFRQNCVTCHGADGALGLNGAKNLSESILTLEERINIITNGKKLMTPFGTLLSPQEIKAVAEYTQTFTQ